MADTRDEIKFAVRALFAALLGLALVYFASLLLVGSPIGGLETSGSRTPATVFSMQRSPITLADAILLVQQGRISLVDINTIPANAEFQLQPSPNQLWATPARQWKGAGYAVELFDPDQPAGIGVLTPGQLTIGLDDQALGQLLQEIGKQNRTDPCRVIVFDQRPIESRWPGAVTSATDCPFPTPAS
jgi:hypothetical protein